jgi:GT2 family glycosyltransferase
MPRKPIETFLQLYCAPYSFWAAARKAIRLVKESGGKGLFEAVKQKLSHPSMPIDVLRVDSGKRLTYEERWVIRGHGLTYDHSVSVIILTKGNQALINACLKSLERSILPAARLEVLVVNNGEQISLPLTYPFPLRLLRETLPFNWAAYNNRAAQHAESEFLLFLNDDVEALHGGWLDAMLAEAVLPQVGVVGAKLLYPDGAIQHCGITLDLGGDVRHSYKFQARDIPGNDGECLRPHQVTAVTGACLLTNKEIFQLYRFDERFAASHNDVDYCLRLSEADMQVILTPYAELVHHETATRSLRVSRQENASLRRKWAPLN